MYKMYTKTTEAGVTAQEEHRTLQNWSSAPPNTTALPASSCRGRCRDKSLWKKSSSAAFQWLRAKSVRGRLKPSKQSAGRYLGAEGVRDPD